MYVHAFIIKRFQGGGYSIHAFILGSPVYMVENTSIGYQLWREGPTPGRHPTDGGEVGSNSGDGTHQVI
jgi:hypothetical protein